MINELLTYEGNPNFMDLTKIVFKDEFNNLPSHLKIIIKEKEILMILLILLLT